MADHLIELGPGVSISLDGLLGDKLLLFGNSNSGKSRLIRRICEQVGTRLPIFVFDLEGEFSTLRQKLPIVLAGDDGEVDVSVETAAKLARRLVELGVNAVLNLHGMTKREKRGFVREFLQSMIDLPRKLWGPRLVILDEIHEYCPQTGAEADARETVNRFMALVRKRGSGVIGATQRMAKLDKDSAAEFNNVCVGRCTLDVDLKRASERIYFPKEKWSDLRSLKPGQFYAVGPSFQHEDVKLFRSGEISTHHPSPGERRRLVPPPPSKAILKYADELKDLKTEVRAEASLLDTLRKENEQLKRDAKKGGAMAELAKLRAEVDFYRNRPRPTLSARDIEVEKRLGGVAAIDAATPLLQELSQQFASLGLTVNGAIRKILDQRRELTRPPPRTLPNGKDKSLPEQRNVAPAKSISRTPISFSPSDADVGTGGMRRMLVALAQHPDGLEAAAIGLFAHVASKGGTFSTYMGRLRSHGWVEKQGSLFVATEAGVAALGSFDPLPSGAELAEYWIDWAGGGGQSRLLRAVLDAGEAGIDKDAAAAEANLAGNAGTFSTYLGRLRTANLIESFRDNGKMRLRAAATLLGA